jgi:para-aminobenzoate synthetase
VAKLQEPKHGLVRPVNHSRLDIFRHIGEFSVTCYHSLHVILPTDPSNVQLQPLAWDSTDPWNGEVLMGVRHISKPLWGVQYHPESICTDPEGRKIISTWWIEATHWNSKHGRQVKQDPVPPPTDQMLSARWCDESSHLADQHFQELSASGLVPPNGNVRWEEIHAPGLDLVRLCEPLQIQFSESILLSSGRAVDQPVIQDLGQFSIIAVISQPSLKIQYQVAQNMLTLDQTLTNTLPSPPPEGVKNLHLPSSFVVSDFWSYINRFMSNLSFTEGSSVVPFWGGLMGYVSYEAALQSISVDVKETMESASPNDTRKSDIQFVLVERSIVIDHLSEMVYVQTLRDDENWLDSIIEKMRLATGSPVNGHRIVSPQQKLPKATKRSITANPRSWVDYTQKISKCNDSIRAGDSYEICLTDNTKIYTPVTCISQNSSWHLFKKLSRTNPAPFSAYIRLKDSSDGLTIVSSSPERFLRWTRDGNCQFRPIKGTVKKTPGVTYEDAAKILNSSKERAENLMITDLIRHDLHGVAGAGHVSVPKLMQIEEYATVYQLVSVVEGSGIQNNSRPMRNTNGTSNPGHADAKSGIEVLAASLPPGSMTGAPKKRSCELLAEIEQHKPRGIYSGVIGYIDVGGGGDFSVVIRTAYKWDSDTCNDPNKNEHDRTNEIEEINERKEIRNRRSSSSWEEWTVGAGGAITAQSDPDLEYQEMLTKLNSVLGGFNMELTLDKSEIRRNKPALANMIEREKGPLQQGQSFQNTLKCDRFNS